MICHFKKNEIKIIRKTISCDFNELFEFINPTKNNYTFNNLTINRTMNRFYKQDDKAKVIGEIIGYDYNLYFSTDEDHNLYKYMIAIPIWFSDLSNEKTNEVINGIVYQDRIGKYNCCPTRGTKQILKEALRILDDEIYKYNIFNDN